MKFLNYTPHRIKLNDGRVFDSEGSVRVETSYSAVNDSFLCDEYLGTVKGLPDRKEGVMIIVSKMIMMLCDRSDLVCPATGHPEAVRDSRGIVSVPCFISHIS